MKKIIALLVITLSITFSQLTYQSNDVKIDKNTISDANLLPPQRPC
jgi:hypothetical protein